MVTSPSCLARIAIKGCADGLRMLQNVQRSLSKVCHQLVTRERAGWLGSHLALSTSSLNEPIWFSVQLES